jgi:H+/Cl- antiporter ClcA
MSAAAVIVYACLAALRSGRFAPAVAIGLTFGGSVGTIAAFPLFKCWASTSR